MRDSFRTCVQVNKPIWYFPEIFSITFVKMALEKFKETRTRLHNIIFEADTPEGKAFDVILFIMIIASVLVVILDSVAEMRLQYHRTFIILEWIFTILFTIEYILRIITVKKPWNYITSFYGVIDFLSIIPSYLTLFFGGLQSLLIIRSMRLLRVFRIFKLGSFLVHGKIISEAVKRSRPKIAVFLYFVLLMVTIIGSLMYLLEGGKNEAFDNIPRSIYWAVVTLTTVGYGDITPHTNIGQFLSAIVMIMGYAVIAVPTGIMSAEMIKGDTSKPVTNTACPHCSRQGHEIDAKFCKYCGGELNGEDEIPDSLDN